MITSTEKFSHNPHIPDREKRRPVSREEMELFCSLLGEDSFTLPVNTALSRFPEVVDYQVSTDPLSATQEAGTPAGYPQRAIFPPEALLLRACTGPLAGLRIQAGWQGTQLVIKLSSTPPPLAERLSRQRKRLSQALSDALGVPVKIEIEHAV